MNGLTAWNVWHVRAVIRAGRCQRLNERNYVEDTSCICICDSFAGQRVWRRILGTVAGADTVAIAVTDGRFNSDHDSGRCIDSREPSLQPGSTRRSRRHDGDLDEHRFHRAHNDLGRRWMELGNVAATSAVLDDVLECRHVPLSLLDSPRHGRHRRCALRIKAGTVTVRDRSDRRFPHRVRGGADRGVLRCRWVWR